MSEPFGATLSVADFMTANPLTVDSGLSLADAQDRMFANNVRHLVVTDGGHLVGILSTRDTTLANAVSGDSPLTVADAMVKEPYRCTQGTPLSTIIEKMEAKRWGTAVVTDGAKIVGLFTTTDALRALRCAIAGEMVGALVEPTHVVAEHERQHVEHSYRASQGLRSRGGGPSPHTGKLGQF